MRGRYKAWAKPFLNEHPDLVYQSIEGQDAFLSSSPLYLEIGMGKGDFIIGMAKKQPGNYLGLEREISVMGIAAKKIEAEDLPNIRLRAADFDIVKEEIKDIRFGRIYLYFSDPWPKKRHEKRRLSFAPRLKDIASFLKEGGVIVFKSDNVQLYEFTLEQIPLAGLRILENTDDYLFDEEHDVMSEYEKNFRSQGKPITRIVISR